MTTVSQSSPFVVRTVYIYCFFLYNVPSDQKEFVHLDLSYVKGFGKLATHNTVLLPVKAPKA